MPFNRFQTNIKAERPAPELRASRFN
jgi:hypothetical protein